MKKRKWQIIIAFLCAGLNIFLFSQNKGYSRQLQQAIRLYEEGKNVDAMDKFMDIMVNGTPEEKAIAQEYLSKITGAPTYQSDAAKYYAPQNYQSSSVQTISGSQSTQPIMETKTALSSQKQPVIITQSPQNNLPSIDPENIIKQLRRNLMISLSNSNILKLYMDSSNQNPLYIVVKEEKILNENMTFKEEAREELSKLGGLLITLGNVVIDIFPNGSVIGNMKIANIRKASILHSFFTSYGIPQTKLRLDVIGENTNISKQIDDLNGIILAINYAKTVDLVYPELNSVAAYVGIYPQKINLSKNESAVIEFSAINGKKALSSWKLEMRRKEKSNIYTIQKIEGNEPIYSQIVFNGREKLIGNPYPSGDYEFYLEVTDLHGNISTARRSIYLISENYEKISVVEKKEEKFKQSLDYSLSKVYKIYFKPGAKKGSVEITELSKKNLEEAVSEFKKSKKRNIILEAYAYNKEKNPKTSGLKRANTVKNYLIKNYKIPSKKIEVNVKVVNIRKNVVEIKLK